jgi:hypothetical protein
VFDAELLELGFVRLKRGNGGFAFHKITIAQT